MRRTGGALLVLACCGALVAATGGECQFNFQCNFPDQGRCVDGSCQCYNGWGICSHCLYSDADIAGGATCPVVDIGDPIPSGGFACEQNRQCANGGTCDIAEGETIGVCSCFTDWFCSDCSLTISQIEEEVTCPATRLPAVVGGSDCQFDCDCGRQDGTSGQCRNGKCSCYQGFVCNDCSQTFESYTGEESCVAPDIERETVPVGGGACLTSLQCGLGAGGLCIGLACSCYPGYFCGDCSKTGPEICGGDACATLSVPTPAPFPAGALKDPIQLTYTVRDFRPAFCTTNSAENWNCTLAKKEYSGFTIASSECEISECLNPDGNGLGELNGHPDFEIPSNLYSRGINDGPVYGLVSDTLMFDESGIPKPVWASSGPTDACPAAEDGFICRANTGADNFNQWYRNVNAVNRAVTKTLILEHDPASDTFVYDSAAFFPLDDIDAPASLPLTNLEADYLNFCSVESPDLCRGTDANTIKFCQHPSQNNCTHNYLFTTEFHTFFQYKGDEEFSFKGDDDVWVFVNNKLEADVGGLHVPWDVKVKLNNLTHSNLVVGETYAFDLYHAERHTTGSNFRIQTSLEEACNVRSSGTDVFNLADNSAGFDFSSGVTLSDIGQYFTLVNTNFQENQGIRLISNGNSAGSTGYVWTNTVQNIGQGFTVDFNFLVLSGDNDGFAFVMQNEGIAGLNGGTGRNLAFGGIANSVAVSFDFCASRDNRMCTSEEIAIVYQDENGLRQKLARLDMPQGNKLADGTQHSIRIEYLGNPDWMQVFVDGELTLLARDIDLTSKVGGLAAFLGFSASTSEAVWAAPADVILLSWTLKVVGISAERSCIRDSQTLECLPTLPSQEVVSVIGSVDFTVQAKDVCGENVQYGGSEDLISVELVQALTPQSRHRLQENPHGDVNIVDLGNGTYSVSIIPPSEGTYTMVVQILGDDILGSPFANIVEADVYIPPTPAPMASDEIGGIPLWGFGILMGLFTILAGMFLYGLSRLKRYQKKWREGKEFVERGMERRYAPDNTTLNPMIDKKIHDLERRLKDAQAEYDALANQSDAQDIMENSESQKNILLKEIRELKKDIDDVESPHKKKKAKGKKKKAFEPTSQPR